MATKGIEAAFVAEVPDDQPVDVRIVLGVADASAFTANPVVDVVRPFEPTHWGTQVLTVRDPDGRLWRLQASGVSMYLTKAATTETLRAGVEHAVAQLLRAGRDRVAGA